MLVGEENAVMGRLVIGLLLGVALLVFTLKSSDFRGNRDHLLGGLVVGLAVLGAWYVSSNIFIDADSEMVSLSEYYEQWDMLADSDEGKPAAGRPLSPQSYTFINPMGQTFGYLSSGLQSSLLTFGVVAVFVVWCWVRCCMR